MTALCAALMSLGLWGGSEKLDAPVYNYHYRSCSALEYRVNWHRAPSPGLC
jgi:hypothetical protein